MKRYNQNNHQPFILRIYKYVIFLIIFIIIINYIYSNTSLFYRRTIILPFSFHLNKSSLYLVEGDEYRLYTFGNTDRVEFSSTNFNVAGVNFTGRVKAYNPGKAYIIARSGNKQMRCKVHVININKSKIKLSVGKTYRLRVRGSLSLVSWSSSNTSIATVNMFGKVTAQRRGTAIITAKVKGKVLRAEVIVK